MEHVKLAALLAKAGRDIESTVVGRSMGRTLPEGTRIRIRAGAADAIGLGTVVAVAAGEMIFAHRVVGVARGYVVLRGDAALLCDEPVAVSQLIGVVEACNDGTGWRPLPPPSREVRRISELQRRAILGALGIHIALARGFARLCMRVARRGGVS